MPKGIDPIDYFGMDWIVVKIPFKCGFFDYQIFEETEDMMTDLSPFGTTVKYYKKADSSSGWQELDHKVKTIADWRNVRSRLSVDESRFQKSQAYTESYFVVCSSQDHFWMSFLMCGKENLCCWLVGVPDEMREIYDDYLNFYIGMLDLSLKKGIRFDALWFFSDMAYRSGPMFSPKTFKDVIAPGYLRLRKWCDDNGKYMLLHCDGNIEMLLPEFIKVGFDWIQPLEARAGMDVRKLVEQYGSQITFMGNINADILAKGDKSEIEDEIASKITKVKQNGGYIYHTDHSVPPTISFETYSFAIEKVKKYGVY